jgi:guanyl-specific ribonuclease Sa
LTRNASAAILSSVPPGDPPAAAPFHIESEEIQMSWQDNIAAYDDRIRQTKPVSYPDHKGGNNGCTIYTVPYSELDGKAKNVIRAIRQGNPPKPRGPGQRNGTVHKNSEGYLPYGGEYREYSAADTSLSDAGAVILVHDAHHDNFYITLTHYRGWRRKGVYQNAFYRIKAIPFKKASEGGGPKTLTSSDC